MSRVILPANLARQLRGNQQTLRRLDQSQTPAFAQTACLASAASNYTLPNNAMTLITTLSPEYDYGANWDTTQHGYVCPSVGLYMCTFQAGMGAGSTAMEADLFKNGVRVRQGVYGSGVQLGASLGVSGVPCAAGDVLDLRAYQNSGASHTGGASYNTFLMVVQIA